MYTYIAFVSAFILGDFFLFIHIFSFLIRFFFFLSLAFSFVFFFLFISSFCFFSVQYFLDGWLASPVLKLSFEATFNDFALLFDSRKKYETFINNICHYQPEANSTETIYLFRMCSDHKRYFKRILFVFFCFLSVTFGDIVFFRIHYTLIKSHHDAVDYSNNNDIFWLWPFFMGDELISF